jgi:subtilisin family serine protease
MRTSIQRLLVSACIAAAGSMLGMGAAPSVASDSQPAAAYGKYYFKKFEPLTLDASRVAVQARDGAALIAGLKAVGLNPASAQPWPIAGWWLIDVPQGVRIEALVASLAQQPTIDFASPVFRSLPLGADAKTHPIFPTREIAVGFAPATPMAQRDQVLATNALSAQGGGELLDRDWAGMPGVDRSRSASKNGFEVLAQANAIAQRADVLFAEPDMMITGSSDLIPNDTYFNNLWGIHNTGQTGGTADADMNGPEAWDITTGSSSVTVAIFDIGVQLNHPDLNIAAVNADFTGQGGGGAPVNSCDKHGTACASCVSGIINNGIGVVGIAPSCRAASARIGVSTIPCDGTWSGSLSNTVNALSWCQTNGYRVTSNSNSYGSTSAAVDAAYTTARNAGIVHFASSGNSGAGSIAYPASSPAVNAVGAINHFGAITSFSQYGTGQKFAAPGQDIYAADRTGADGYASGDYTVVSGTSFSCPYTAGVAALVISRNPSLTAPQVESIMYNTAKDRGAAGYDTTYGYGIPNAYAAVYAALPPPANDRCASAIALASGTTITGTLDNAVYTASDGGSACAGPTNTQDVWYSFTAPAEVGGTLRVSTCGTRNTYGIDTVMNVYDSCGGAVLACNDDSSCGFDSLIDVSLAAGQNVRIRISRFGGGGGSFVVNTNFTLANDACSGAIDLSSAGASGLTFVGTLVGATNDGTASCGSSASNADVWYRFTAPSSGCGPGLFRVTTCGSNDANGFDSVLSLHHACGEAPFICVDDGATPGIENCGTLDTGAIRDSATGTVLNPGETVFVRVSKYFSSSVGTFRINAFFTTPANDSCASPIAIGDGSYTFCTTNATTDGPTEANLGFCCGDLQVGHDVWYLYTAPSNGTTRVSLCGSSYDSKVAIYLGSACPSGPNTAIAGNDDSCGLQSVADFGTVAGQQYLIRVGGYVANVGTGQMNVANTPPACPADFNQDGGVDGSDVEAFFAAWEAGDSSADLNQDGGVDGSDVDFFFAHWEAGC